MMYPTGQNDSLELMLAKFTAAKNLKKLNSLKASSTRYYRAIEPPAYSLKNTKVVRKSFIP